MMWLMGCPALLKMQNYENGFTRRAAKTTYEEMELRWRNREIVEIMVAEDIEAETPPELEGTLQPDDWKKADVSTSSARRVVAKLYRQLGHPNNAKLVSALRDASISEMVVKQAVDYKLNVMSVKHIVTPPKPSSFFRAVDLPFICTSAPLQLH